MHLLLTRRSPVAHGEGVADDAVAGGQLGEQLRAQLLVQGFQQIEGDDGRLLEIGLKEILVPEADEIVDTCLFCVRAGFSNADRVYVDTHRLNAVKARRRDRDATVARAEIIERSEEHTSELQSLMRTSYAVFRLNKKKQTTIIRTQ